jgi:class 3 adenylate cyclase
MIPTDDAPTVIRSGGEPTVADPTGLPTGTGTFLFTDVEGSTTRWESDRAALAAEPSRPVG